MPSNQFTRVQSCLGEVLAAVRYMHSVQVCHREPRQQLVSKKSQVLDCCDVLEHPSSWQISRSDPSSWLAQDLKHANTLVMSQASMSENVVSPKLQDVGRQLQVGGSNNQLKVWAVSAIQLTCMLLSNSIGIAHFPFTHTTDKSEKNTTLYCHES